MELIAQENTTLSFDELILLMLDDNIQQNRTLFEFTRDPETG